MDIISQIPVEEIEYPEDDGLSMSTWQFHYVALLKCEFDTLFREDANTFVAGNLLWYPVEGNNVIRTAPRVFVAKGRPKGDRSSYMQWREGGVAPQVVWEILSLELMTADDIQAKFDFYERYGVQEYYEFNPDNGILRGWLRQGHELIEIKQMHCWVSPLLQVRLELNERKLVVYRPDGRRFLTYQECVEECERITAESLALELQTSRLQAEKEVIRERAAREKAEARVARYADKLRQLGINPYE